MLRHFAFHLTNIVRMCNPCEDFSLLWLNTFFIHHLTAYFFHVMSQQLDGHTAVAVDVCIKIR